VAKPKPKTESRKFFVVGADVSVNHSALVVLDQDGEEVFTRYLTTKVKDVKKSLGGARLFKQGKEDSDRAAYGQRRLGWLAGYYFALADEIRKEADARGADFIYVSLEDYAYAATGKTFHLGECGGLWKIVCHSQGFKLRLHDPMAPKMFATGRGNASKIEVREGAVEKWTGEFGFDRFPVGPPSDPEASVQGDVVDAYVLARMGLTEVWLRDGEVHTRDLPEEERKIFNRTTKTFPTNILSRNWL
jgi:hypothetical protein